MRPGKFITYRGLGRRGQEIDPAPAPAAPAGPRLGARVWDAWWGGPGGGREGPRIATSWAQAGEKLLVLLGRRSGSQDSPGTGPKRGPESQLLCPAPAAARQGARVGERLMGRGGEGARPRGCGAFWLSLFWGSM